MDTPDLLVAQPRVQIIGKDHPHRGEYGRFTGKVIRLITGATMALVKLEACKHGGDSCYVSAGDIREVGPLGDPKPKRKRR